MACEKTVIPVCKIMSRCPCTQLQTEAAVPKTTGHLLGGPWTSQE